ncbi:MAG TPA: AIR synthase-related protein [Streptomyces sp.]
MGRSDGIENRQVTLDDDAYGRLGDVLAGLVAPSGTVEHTPATGQAVVSGSYTVDPPFFGDGDIGRLAVCAAVNDLAARGADPQWVTLGLTVEAGLPATLLRRVLESAREAASEAGVRLAGPEARVVRAGDANRLFAHTTALGTMPRPRPPAAGAVRPGDLLLLTAPLGGWAVHLLSIREGLGLENLVPSGCHPLNAMLRDVGRAAPPDAVRRVDRIARGGLARVLQTQAAATGRSVQVFEEAVPMQHEVSTASELLGIDPLHVTDEGCLCLCVAAEAAGAVREALRAHPYGCDAAVIGEVTPLPAPVALLVGHEGRTKRMDARASLWPEPSRLR